MTKKRKRKTSTTLATRVATTREHERRVSAVAEIMVSGVEINAVTAASYSTLLGEPDVTECVAAVIAATQRVNAGDLSALEATLTAQAITLNAVFTQLAYQTSKMLWDTIYKRTR
jgi:hypothetical protein